MGKTNIKIPVEKLRMGLYVSELDRPWVESPFLFQGFEIDNEDDLSTLRKICREVQVEVTMAEAEELLKQSTPYVPPPLKTAGPIEQIEANLSARLSRVPSSDPVPLKTELSRAGEVFGHAKRTVTDIFDRMRNGGGGLELPMLTTVMDTMVDSVFRNRDALGWLARLQNKDDYLYKHSLSTAVLALAFGRHLGLTKDTLRSLGVGAMLLDVGKTQFADELLRRPNELSPGEWKQMRSHVELSLKLIENDPTLDHHARDMVAAHHERFDGSGYPKGLKGNAIPLVAQIAGIVDSYDAMTSERAYAKTKSSYDAVRELKRLSGTSFQPELVELFIQAVGVFPTGTLVELNSGEVGVVVAQNRFRRLRPEIMLILGPDKKIRDEFSLIDLQKQEGSAGDGTPSLWIVRGLERGAYGIDPTEYFL